MSKPVYDPATGRLYMTPSSAREAGHDPVTGRIFMPTISAQEAEEAMSRWRETHPEISAFWRDPSPLQAAMASPEPWPLDPVEKRRKSAPPKPLNYDPKSGTIRMNDVKIAFTDPFFRHQEPFSGLIYNPDKGSVHANLQFDPLWPKWITDLPVATRIAEKRYTNHRWYEAYDFAGPISWTDPTPLQAAVASPEPWPLDPVEKRRESTPKGEAEETRFGPFVKWTFGDYGPPTPTLYYTNSRGDILPAEPAPKASRGLRTEEVLRRWPPGKPIVPETTPEKPGLGKYWEPKDAGIYRMPEQQFEPPPRASKGPSLEHIFRDPPGFDESLAWTPPRPKPGLWGGAPTVLVTREHLDGLKKAVADNAQRMIQVCAERDTARTQLMETRAELAKVARERKAARRAEHLAKAELKVALAVQPVPAPDLGPPLLILAGDTIRAKAGGSIFEVVMRPSPEDNLLQVRSRDRDYFLFLMDLNQLREQIRKGEVIWRPRRNPAGSPPEKRP